VKLNSNMCTKLIIFLTYFPVKFFIIKLNFIIRKIFIVKSLDNRYNKIVIFKFKF